MLLNQCSVRAHVCNILVAMSGFATLLVFLCLTSLHGVDASFNLSISPSHVRINKTRQTVIFRCNVKVPLVGCQFNFIPDLPCKKNIIDLSQGRSKKFSPTYLGITNYTYVGRGLEKGDCGIQLEVWGFKRWVVGCRVREQIGRWRYALADMFARGDDHAIFNISVEPEMPVVLPGRDLNLMCKGPENADTCVIKFKGLTRDLPELKFNGGALSTHKLPPHVYATSGLQKNECGLRLAKVSELNNGPASCAMTGDLIDSQGVGFINIIVAAIPSAPVLIVVQGNPLKAWCSVDGGRPMPNITWYVGDKVVRDDRVDDKQWKYQDEWKWPWDVQPHMQSLVYVPQPGDEAKLLKCVVTHVALEEPLVVTNTINLGDLVVDPDQNKSKMCRRLSFENVDISCEYGGNPIPCNRKSFVGAKAISTCKEGFSPEDDNDTNRTMSCLPDGKWSRYPQTCKGICGIPSSNTQYIFGGAMRGVVPWQVGIYRKVTETYWKHICGGTLIDSKFVLSAAHCFWDDTEQRLRHESLYMIAVGKDLIDFDVKEHHDQRRPLSKIYIHERYRDQVTNFRYDIALLKLKHRVKLEAGIRVACVDWKGEKEEEQLVSGRNGTVAGWGTTETGLPSKRLLTAQLPFVKYTKCVDGLRKDVKSLLTYDKFCAGYENKHISVCKGDSGGGLVFQDVKSGSFYIQGIVSTNFQPSNYSGTTCYSQKYTAFTQVSLYVDWLKDIME